MDGCAFSISSKMMTARGSCCRSLTSSPSPCHRATAPRILPNDKSVFSHKKRRPPPPSPLRGAPGGTHLQTNAGSDPILNIFWLLHLSHVVLFQSTCPLKLPHRCMVNDTCNLPCQLRLDTPHTRMQHHESAIIQVRHENEDRHETIPLSVTSAHPSPFSLATSQKNESTTA